MPQCFSLLCDCKESPNLSESRLSPRQMGRAGTGCQRGCEIKDKSNVGAWGA